jgi:hypothetical protein
MVCRRRGAARARFQRLICLAQDDQRKVEAMAL